MNYRWAISLIFLFTSPLPTLCKRGSSGGSFGGGGGGFNRGSSGARQQGAGGFQGNQGGFNGRNNFNNGGVNPGGVRPMGGVNNGGFRNPGSSFSNQGFSNTGGLGSASRASGFRNALIGGLAGAAGGILLYEGTKAIIRSASSPFHYDNRNYYWGDQYIRNGPNQFTCSKPLSEIATAAAQVSTPAPPVSDPNSTTVLPPAAAGNIFNNIQFQDGNRPKNVVWSCITGREVCCGMDCCPAPATNTASSSKSEISTATAIILGIVLTVVLGICCCCCLTFLICPQSFNRLSPNNQNGAEAQYQQTHYGDNAQGYPMQSYGNHDYSQQAYSQPGYYPKPASSYPQQYPPNPTY